MGGGKGLHGGTGKAVGRVGRGTKEYQFGDPEPPGGLTTHPVVTDTNSNVTQRRMTTVPPTLCSRQPSSLMAQTQRAP